MTDAAREMTAKVEMLAVTLATPENFAPFGQVIVPTEDGTPFGPDDAQLDLMGGIPRFYAMRLYFRGNRFAHITRHAKVTQCLGAMMGHPWKIAVAPPDASRSDPDPASIRAFYVPGDRFVKLNTGTWHAGPFFDAQQVDFYNLELSATNLDDHETCRLDKMFGVAFEFGAAPKT
jgi:ureidoglycolate hydrolase